MPDDRGGFPIRGEAPIIFLDKEGEILTFYPSQAFILEVDKRKPFTWNTRRQRFMPQLMKKGGFPAAAHAHDRRDLARNRSWSIKPTRRCGRRKKCYSIGKLFREDARDGFPRGRHDCYFHLLIRRIYYNFILNRRGRRGTETLRGCAVQIFLPCVVVPWWHCVLPCGVVPWWRRVLPWDVVPW